MIEELTEPLKIIASYDFNTDELEPDKYITIDDYTVAYFDGKTTIVGKPKVFIGKSSSENFEVVIVKKSRGATKQLAMASAERVIMHYTINESNLVLNPNFFLPNEEKWRAQEVEITINVPENRMVYIDKSLETILSDEQNYCFCWPDEMVDKTWIMKGERLVER